jgi:WD40 repeat protein
MSGRDELDRRLAAWMTETVSSSPPAGRFEQAMEATARRRPRPPWLAAFGSDWVGTTAPRRLEWAWPGLRRALVAAAMVALLAAAIVGAAMVGAYLLDHRRPAWRLGGLAYSVDGDIYVASADGGSPVLIADGIPDSASHSAPSYWDPQWSPDGRYLMYQDSNSITQVVHVVDPQGRPVASFPGWYSTWASDSSRIATWGETDQKLSFGKVDVRAMDGRLLTSVLIPDTFSGSGDQRPGWLPDGSAIVLPRYTVAEAGPAGLQAWVFPINGAAPRRLSVEVKGYGPPAFSPDGTRIAIDVGNDVFLIAADGTEAQRLPTKPGAGLYTNPLWSPGGDRIAVTRSRESIQVVDVKTGTAVPVHESSGEGVRALNWSPDGRTLLVIQGDGNPGGSSVWSVAVDGSGGHVVVKRADAEGADGRWVKEGAE